MQIFRDAIDECGFLDLGFLGSQYTWQKNFTNGHLVWERLDRGLATNDWLIKFADSWVHHLSLDTFDHYPLWIIPESLELPCISKPFRFEEMWLFDKGCTETVEAVWASQDFLDP